MTREELLTRYADEHEEMLWSKIDVRGPEECWPWMAYTSRKGYGRVWCDGRLLRTHRMVFEAVYGPIPKRLRVCHSCDTPPCCNPEHLAIGTQKDSLRDAAQRGRTQPERLSRGDRNGSRTKPQSRSRGDQHYSRTQPERLARGEKHSLSKLTEDAVRAIREDARILRKISADYAVSITTISQIKNRKAWAHVK